MSDESRNPDLYVGDLRYDIDQANRDNIESIRTVMDKLQTILVDLDNRLKELGG